MGLVPKVRAELLPPPLTVLRGWGCSRLLLSPLRFQISTEPRPSATTRPQSYLLESGLESDQAALVPSSCCILDLKELIHLLGSLDV